MMHGQKNIKKQSFCRKCFSFGLNEIFFVEDEI